MANVHLTGRQAVLSLEAIDEISMRVSKALAIIDLLGEVELDIDDGTRKNAAWAGKDFLREIKEIIDDLPNANAVKEVAA